MGDAASRFIGAMALPMRAADIVADGAPKRFRGEHDKPGTRLRFYAFNLNPIPHGFAGSFSGGDLAFEFWRDPEARAIDWSEWSVLCASKRTMRQAIEHEQHSVWTEVRAKADRLLRAAKAPNPRHPHLVRCGIRPADGMKQLGSQLLVPVQRDGTVHNIQFIDPDGTTRFLSGGRHKGCYFQIGSPSGAICVAADVAAAVAAHEISGLAAAAAFTVENLSHAARKIWITNGMEILIVVIAADQDLDAAVRAATGVSGWIAHPDFTDAQPAANLLKAVPEGAQ
ncbi:MAG: hypothetical protein ACYC1G_14000 [Thiobacillus sp.]